MYDAVLIDFMHLLSILKTLEWLYWVRHKVILAQFPVSNTGKRKCCEKNKQTNIRTGDSCIFTLSEYSLQLQHFVVQEIPESEILSL